MAAQSTKDTQASKETYYRKKETYYRKKRHIVKEAYNRGQNRGHNRGHVEVKGV
jgi:hypothetical protein